jgi:hypothetical protein
VQPVPADRLEAFLRVLDREPGSLRGIRCEEHHIQLQQPIVLEAVERVRSRERLESIDCPIDDLRIATGERADLAVDLAEQQCGSGLRRIEN